MVMKGTRRNNLYYYNGSTMTRVVATVSSSDEDLEITSLRHRRLGHEGEITLLILVKQGLLKGENTYKLEFCEHCVLGKQRRVKFGTTIHNIEGILDYVHSFVWRPTKSPSKGGKHYFVTFVDAFSKRTWVYVMKSKSDVYNFSLNGKIWMKHKLGRKSSISEQIMMVSFAIIIFLNYVKRRVLYVTLLLKIHYSRMGVAERMNRTLLEKVRCMLSTVRFDKEFWVEAVTYACHLINHLLSTVIDDRIPLEVWSKQPVSDYDSLHVFGSTTYYHVKESKLDPRAKKQICLGFSSGIKGYNLWCPSLKKIVSSRDVTFDESLMLKKLEN